MQKQVETALAHVMASLSLRYFLPTPIRTNASLPILRAVHQFGPRFRNPMARPSYP